MNILKSIFKHLDATAVQNLCSEFSCRLKTRRSGQVFPLLGSQFLLQNFTANRRRKFNGHISIFERALFVLLSDSYICFLLCTMDLARGYNDLQQRVGDLLQQSFSDRKQVLCYPRLEGNNPLRYSRNGGVIGRGWDQTLSQLAWKNPVFTRIQNSLVMH